MQVFHFSEQSDIEVFVPRPVAIPSKRAAGMDWLNGPLVWAIDDWHQPMYLFPRDCPRILIWPTEATTPEDRCAHWKKSSCRMIAYMEWRWFSRLAGAVLYRYALPSEEFECLNDAGMWVSRSVVRPTEILKITDIGASLDEANLELRVVPTLEPFKGLSSTSLHVSGIRLRNMGGPALP